MNFDRREFLRKSSLIGLAPTIPKFVFDCTSNATAKPDERVLVVLQLDGGNDGINTVVPFADEGYNKHRDKLRIQKNKLLKINKQFGFHPSMKGLAKLWEDNALAVLPAVGYPNPNRSHAVSMAIWQTCSFNELDHNSYGWLGRAFDSTEKVQRTHPSSIFVGEQTSPVALRGRKNVVSSLERLSEYQLPEELLKSSKMGEASGDLESFLRRTEIDAIRMSEQARDVVDRNHSSRYPNSKLANHLKTIAQLIKGGFGTRVYYALQGGYDTHSAQLGEHDRLLSTLSSSIAAFVDDLKLAKIDDRVAILCFSEFGRRVDENGSAGTDHGSAGLTILAGTPVKGGIHGGFSGLSKLDNGGLRSSIDFRAVYFEVLENWLGLQPAFAPVDQKVTLFKT